MTRPSTRPLALVLVLASLPLLGMASWALAGNHSAPTAERLVQQANEACTLAGATADSARVVRDSTMAVQYTLTVSCPERCEESSLGTPAKIAAAIRGTAKLTRALYRNAIVFGVALVRTAAHAVSAIG